MLTRRHFIGAAAALFSAPIAGPSLAQTLPVGVEGRAPISDRDMWEAWDAQVTPAGYDPATSNPWGIDQRFLPRVVEAKPGLLPGDVHVDAVARYLYHIRPGGTAIRYGVAIARGDLYEPGIYAIRRKARWPVWRPTQNMIARDPEIYGQFAGGVDGGPRNPLGSRALYLYEGGRDTYLRIHGSPEARSIGGRASSGCVRMVMAHIIDLYDQVETGSTAFLYPPEDTLAAT
jgi:lipoprotein-anchoring transpeptidase ErfK/SrfK